MHFEDQYHYGIILARNAYIIRNTRDAKLKARVAKDNQDIRKLLKEA